MTAAEPGKPVTLSAGLYLIIAHSRDLEEYAIYTDTDEGTVISTVARYGGFEYAFRPELVSIPTKEADGSGVVRTDGAGEWIFDLTAALKPEKTAKTGSIEIVKNLVTYEGSDADVFIFDIRAEIDGRVVYSDTVALSFDAPGQKRLTVDGLPAGSRVTVTEVYSGGGTDELRIAIGNVPEIVEEGTNFNVIVVYESTPALSIPDGSLYAVWTRILDSGGDVHE